MMEAKLDRKISAFLKKYYIIFAFASLLIPDIQLRWLVSPKVFSPGFYLPVSLGFTALWIVIILGVCRTLLPRVAGRVVYIIFSAFFILLSCAQYIYFKIFNQFFWLKSIALAGEGAGYIGIISKGIDAWLIACTASSVICLLFAAISWDTRKMSSRRWVFVPICAAAALILLHGFMLIREKAEGDDNWNVWADPKAVYAEFNDQNKCLDICGIYQFTLKDVCSILGGGSFGDEDFEYAERYFDQKGGLTQNDYSGIFEGKNLIVVMMESIDSWMIDERYTPTLCMMMEKGINLTGYYSPFFGAGHTFNAEFSFNTGYFTPRGEVSATYFSSNSYPFALPALFTRQGYSVNSYHYNNSEFYNRGIMHKSFGYESYNSFVDFGLSQDDAQRDSNALQNGRVFEHMTASEPFFDFMITYSAHLPYNDGNDIVRTAKEKHPELVGLEEDEEKNNCLLLAADTDDFFETLLTALDESGLAEDTVIIAFTDHYTYGFSDIAKVEEYKDGKNLFNVPAFIYAKGIEPCEISTPMMPIDWLPTIANLFALGSDISFLGGDVTSPDNDGFVVFEDYSWISGDIASAELDSDAARSSFADAESRRARELFDINDIVVLGDYYSRIAARD